MVEDIKAEFRNQPSGGSLLANFEYTVTLPSGSYYDSYVRVMMLKG